MTPPPPTLSAAVAAIEASRGYALTPAEREAVAMRLALDVAEFEAELRMENEKENRQ